MIDFIKNILNKAMENQEILFSDYVDAINYLDELKALEDNNIDLWNKIEILEEKISELKYAKKN